MNKKKLTNQKTVVICIFMTLVHCFSVACFCFLAKGGFSIGTVAFSFDVPELLCFMPFFFPVIADVILRIKTDIKPYATLISAFAAVIMCFIVYVIYPHPDRPMGAGENYVFVMLALINFAVRCVYGIADVIILKRYKQIVAAVIVAVIGIASVFGGYVFENDIYRLIVEPNLGTADKTGSWGSINQNVVRPENWEQIVTDSPYKLGEIVSVFEDGYTNNYCDMGTYPYIDGSTVCVPMAVEFARQHLGFEDKTANEFVQFSTTHYAYENLMDEYATSQNYVHYNLDAFINMGSVDLVIATEPSDEELEQAQRLGINLVKTPVCYDAFVFITHKDNPIDSLSVEQIQKIYTGEIKNWKEVGGKNEKIRAFQREKNSGSQTAMENLVMGGSDMIDPIEIKVIEGMGMLVDAVAEYENETASIGYTYRYYIDTLYKNDNIKTIAVNGIVPTDDNIRNGSYPFTTNYYGVIREGNEEETGGKFLEWILSDEGQQCVGQAGYITLE